MRRIFWLFMAGINTMLALPAALLIIPFLGMRSLVRRASQFFEAEYLGEGEILQYDPVLGWRPKPNLDTHYFDRAGTSYALTDGDGWPGRRPLSQSDVVVLADSYGFGYGVARGECFTDLVPDLRIKAVACPVYDLVQEVLALEAIAPQLRNQLILWFIFPENDIVQSRWPHVEGRRKPMLRRSASTGEWEITTDHVSEAPWLATRDPAGSPGFADLCFEHSFATTHFSATDYLIERAARLVSGIHQCDLVVLSIPYSLQLSQDGRRVLRERAGNPTPFDPELADRQIERSCQRLEVPFTPLSRILKSTDYKEDDEFHWNATGHRKVAGLVRELHERWQSRTLGDLAPATPVEASAP